jgi:sortase A
MRTFASRARRPLLGVLAGLALWQGAGAVWIEAKAQLAQRLVARSWRRARVGAADARPWPWADTYPLARLMIPARHIDVYVLAGASGRTLAFGPGHLTGSALPGRPGNAVISGHRDTHFAFLRQLRVGDEIWIERPDGGRRRYLIGETRVVERSDVRSLAPTEDDRLTLVTCYPFAALRPGGPLRYVVTAVGS